MFRRRTEGAWPTPPSASTSSAEVVGEAAAGCERVVLGYTVNREPINEDYSEGIENVAADAQAGLASEIFVRTAKLKDFPWNGWLHVAVSGRSDKAAGILCRVHRRGRDGSSGPPSGDSALLAIPTVGAFIPNARGRGR